MSYPMIAGSVPWCDQWVAFANISSRKFGHYEQEVDLEGV